MILSTKSEIESTMTGGHPDRSWAHKCHLRPLWRQLEVIQYGYEVIRSLVGWHSENSISSWSRSSNFELE